VAGSPYLQIDNLTKAYRSPQGEVRALEGVSLSVLDGEFVAVLGPSGCGKSTMMLMVAGLLPQTSGEIRVAGQVVRGPVTDVGIVFQNSVLLDWLTVLGNAMFLVDLRRLPRRQYEPHARELLRAVGLTGFEQHRPYQLSGGMKQRTSICRALVLDPPLLLMDEPFGALDALTREQMRLDLERLWMESPKTVLFITHSVAEAVLLADRVVILSPRPGRIERVIEIDLPRPRHLAARRDPKFAEYEQTITDIFLAGGVLHA
jgi:NitT/TauT family transport system ATP-binding protein